MPNLFIILGHSDWGKTHTLMEIFGQKVFFSNKNPIKFSNFWYTVINPSNDDVGIERYMDYFKKVEAKHYGKNHNFVITLCPVLDFGHKDCTEFLNHVRSQYSSFVITLRNDWGEIGYIEQQNSEH